MQDVTIYNDSGTQGSTIDPSLLLYIGGKKIVPQTFTSKDNTLFLGNYRMVDSVVPENIRKLARNLSIDTSVVRQSEDSYPVTGYYYYKNRLSIDVPVASFKYLETYRFGI